MAPEARERLALVLAMALSVAGVAGCRSRPEPLGGPREELLRESTSPADRLCRALAAAAATRDVSLARDMLPHLENRDAGVRFCAYQALVSLTGEDPVGYRPYAPEEDRARAVARWRDHLDGRGR